MQLEPEFFRALFKRGNRRFGQSNWPRSHVACLLCRITGNLCTWEMIRHEADSVEDRQSVHLRFDLEPSRGTAGLPMFGQISLIAGEGHLAGSSRVAPVISPFRALPSFLKCG